MYFKYNEIMCVCVCVFKDGVVGETLEGRIEESG